MDKYPELEEFTEQNAAQGDFLAREKELLGDNNEFGAEDGPAMSSDEEPVAEANQELNHSTAADSVTAPVESGASTPAVESSKVPSQFLEEWKVKHELEIERRDKASAEKLKEIQDKAKVSIDDFYSNYNSKKEQSIAQVQKEAEQFVKSRDEQNKGSTWDKVHSLIDQVKVAEGVTPVDKSRFKELVGSLKGDPDAPGAAGY